MISAVLLAARGGNRKTWRYCFRHFGSEVIYGTDMPWKFLRRMWDKLDKKGGLCE